MKSRCNTCKHWKWHSRKQDDEPMHSVSFHYCELMAFVNVPKARQRRKICEDFQFYEEK